MRLLPPHGRSLRHYLLCSMCHRFFSPTFLFRGRTTLLEHYRGFVKDLTQTMLFVRSNKFRKIGALQRGIVGRHGSPILAEQFSDHNVNRPIDKT